MRNVDAHLLEDKMDEAVTQYINSHQTEEGVHVDANTLSLNVQEDNSRVVTIMHHQGYSTLSRQVSVGENEGDGPWGEELLDPDCRLAALVAQLAQNSRSHHHKVSSVREDVDPSVILDAPLRLFNGQTLDHQQEPIVVEESPLPPLPPLQDMKRCPETDWFGAKDKDTLKEDDVILTAGALETADSPAPTKHSKKSLPHKKRISRKLKRNTGNCTPQQDIVVINCTEEVHHEEILPDSFVTAVAPDHLPADAHIAHEVRPMLVCQLCGEFYGIDQLKFYHHLKQHYEPHATIIIENPVPDLVIDKMNNSCIVDNVASLPESIVELSLEDAVAKGLYQPDKHALYTTGDKPLYTNKVHYTIASMEKEPENNPDGQDCPENPDGTRDEYSRLEVYSCSKCNKSFRKQKHCEAHIEEEHGDHTTSKLEDMGEFSEPEDLMEGIHVAVEEGELLHEPSLPHLTVDNGHVHQDHVRHWYMRQAEDGEGGEPAPGAGVETCDCAACAGSEPNDAHHLKEEVLQRILETEVPPPFPDPPLTASEPPAEPETSPDRSKKKGKEFWCPQCGRVFLHRNSLLYHVLSHGGKQHTCHDCGKGFYTLSALKVHKRVHNGDKPYKCDDCGRDFRQWSDLKYHRVSLHSNQKHYKCEFCGKDFARKYSLNVHRRIHTGEKNYKCDYCNKTFRASSYRLSHMRTHTGDRPYKCSTCEKSFRVAGDLRRHMLTHERVRNRFDEQKKLKDEPKKKDDALKTEILQPEPQIAKMKKIAVASTTRPAILRVDKKQKPAKKNQNKKGAPNVTIQNRIGDGQYKISTEYTNNVEVFDTRQEIPRNMPEFNKFKEVYTEGSVEQYKSNEQIVYKDSEHRLTADRDFATLRPMFRENCDDNDKPVLARAENTDGKMQIFTQVEKGNGPTVNAVTLGDVRAMERARGDLNGEENAFLERLTALYNISAV